MKYYVAVLVMVIAVICYQRYRFSFDEREYTSASIVHWYQHKPTHGYDSASNTGYTIGNYSIHPKISPSLFELVRYKKINNYIFGHYNVYKCQLAFVDSGYASVLHFTMFGQENHVHFQESLAFDLDSNSFNHMNYNFHKKDFNLTIRQHIDDSSHKTHTTFKLLVRRYNMNINATIEHIMRNQQCFTMTRMSNVLSHKCYGGTGSGQIHIDYYHAETKLRKYVSYYLTQQLTRTAFDGLRGGSNHWPFVWAMASGFNKKLYYKNNHHISQSQWVGINLGQLAGEAENFIFWSGSIIPVKGLKYQFNSSLQQNQSVLFKYIDIYCRATEPKFELKFIVKFNPNVYKDMGIMKVDMVRMDGYWEGWIEIDGIRNQFDELAGLLEVSDSYF